MIYITGDTHGQQRRWTEEIAPMLNAGDIICVCGDFGVGFWGNAERSEEAFYDWLEEQAYTVLFLDGNHENFDQLNRYPTKLWCGGKVHKLRENVIHLMRGEIYEVEGHRIFVMGGGYSLDRSRREPGVSWWPQEMPSEEEYENARANLERVNYQVDYILTHTIQSETIYYLSRFPKFGIKNLVFEELPLTTFLDTVQKQVAYKRWYFGHLHIDEELWRDQIAMLDAVREIESGRLVMMRKNKKGTHK